MKFLVCFVFLLIIKDLDAICPSIVDRQVWGASAAIEDAQREHPASHVIIHHSTTPTCTTTENCAAIVRGIQKVHTKIKKYRDIGYNFLIGEDGNIYEGVGWDKDGNHDEEFNSKSIGICFIGDYTSLLPNKEAMSALQRLINCSVESGRLIPNYKLLLHRQVKNTKCPGVKLYYEMRTWPNWSPAP